MPNPVSYHVAPRYSSGSPALVDEQTAMRVADDEKKDYERLMDPSYAGMLPADEEKAKKLGLAGIVEARQESKGGWSVLDVLTGERFWRGEVKCNKLLNRDRIIHIDSDYYVNSLRSHNGKPVLPMVIEKLEPAKPGMLIHGKDEHGNEEILFCKNAGSGTFKIERGR